MVLIHGGGDLRSELEQVIHQSACIELRGTAASYADGMALIRATNPGLIVVDLDLTDAGEQIIRQARWENPLLDCLAIGAQTGDAGFSAALQAGATDCMPKSSGAQSIVQEIIRLWDGDAALAFEGSLQSSRRRPRLGGGERELLDLVFRGVSGRELAAILNVSSGAMTSRIRHIFTKLEVSSRSEAIHEATRLGLLSMQKR